MTEYTVFEFLKPVPEEVGSWKILVTLEARSAEAAIRKFLVDFDDTPTQGQFAAVPHRSWKPVKVSVETKTSLKFS